MNRTDSMLKRMGMLVCVAAIGVALSASCVSRTGAPASANPQGVSVGAQTVPAELMDTKYLYEIVRHVYRWALDENDVDDLAGIKDFPFWVKMVNQPLDEGDKSQIAEITMPLVGVKVRVKKPNYTIEEMSVAVTGRTYRITNVSKIDIPRKPDGKHRVINVSYAEMREYLFRTRAEATFPDEALRERLRVAVRTQLGVNPEGRFPGRQIVHLAPLSPVANEVWIYWENSRLLIRFASDIDLVDPAVWKHETLMVKTWDVLNQVVVSLDESAGSNAFMTRDQIGRALYNCLVLGQRLEVTNPQVEK